jgi:cell pole-organizing protein PopZ
MSEGDGVSNNSGLAGVAEPSMEEILASIRRILTEEENERAGAQEEPDDEILVLGSAMLAPKEDPPPVLAEIPASTNFSVEPQFDGQDNSALPRADLNFTAGPLTEPPPPLFTEAEPPTKENHMEDQVQSPEGLVSAAAASEIANTVGSLVRSVSAERAVTVGRPGVTIEDLVREEIKPVLKSWLDTHLPNLVERVVRTEIGRVIDRMQP